MSLHEDDDLFGDGDDGGSLFGGDDDIDHLFDSSDGDEEEQTTAQDSSTPVAAASGIATGFLTFPSVPDPHDALSRGHVGLTSGQHTVSTQNPSGNVWGLSFPEITNSETAVDAQVFRDQAIDHGDQADHEQHDQEAHASPELSPSNAGLIEDVERLLEEDSAADQGEQEQALDTQPLPAPALPYVQPANDVDMVTEYNLLQDQASRCTTSSLGSPPPNIGMELAATGSRWSGAKTRRGIRLPRRIDFDGADIHVLKNHITLNRKDSLLTHYQRLELPESLGKKLQGDLKDYVRSCSTMQHIRQKGTLPLEERRVNFLGAALRILKDDCWGPNWFGPSSQTGATRSLLWPTDSSLLVLRFTGLLYKVADQVRYSEDKKRCRAGVTADERRRQSISLNQTMREVSQAMFIDLTDDGDGVSGAMRSVTPNTSVSSSRPTSSHMSASQSTADGIFVSAQSSNDGSRFPSLAPSVSLPPYKSPAFHQDTVPEFWIIEDSTPEESPSPGAEADYAANGQPNQLTQPKGITLEMLAKQVAELKQRKQSTPATWDVQYRFAFTDAGDAQDLRPPLVGMLADELVMGDKAVRSIRSAFSQAGVPATIQIDGADGPVEVTTQDEWNEAVHAVWQRDGDGAVVDVGIRV